MSNFSEMKNQNDLLEDALLRLKKEYQKPKMSEEQVQALQKKMTEAEKTNQKGRYTMRIIKLAAVCMGFLIILPNTSASVAYAMEQIPIIGQLVEVVTFRNYKYESERNKADIVVPEIQPEGKSADVKVQETLEQTTDEINAEIRRITDELTEEFEAYLTDEEGYQDIVVKSEVLATTQSYFTLKLICYQGAGSGRQWNYYYTIDLNTGERLQLKDLFQEGADYITPISENIKEQMQAQMSEDENVYYWLHDEIEAWNFQAITEDTSFYMNEKGCVVISLDEGEVAPMYMGCVEFVIPQEVLCDIQK